MYEAELLTLLAQHFIFSILDDTERQQLVRKMERTTFMMGDNIVTQGELGDSAFLVLSGKVRVLQQSSTGRPVTVGVLSRGDLFGERSIITKEPRIATVRASEEVVAFRIHHDDFEQLLQDNSELPPYFDHYLQKLAVINFLRVKTFLGVLPPRQIIVLAEKFRELVFHADEVIIQAGSTHDLFYMIKAGQVKAVSTVSNRNDVLSVLYPGDYFGERSILLQPPRLATIIATQDTTCLTLRHEEFAELLDSSEKLKDAFLKRLQEYEAAATSPAAETSASLHTASPQFATRALPHAGDANPDSADSVPRRKKKRRFRRYPWTRQHDASDCGAACLTMISRYYGVRLSIGRLRDILHIDREGASLYNIAAGAETLGYMSRAMHADYAALLTLQDDFPAIAHWKGYHYIVLYEVTEKQVVVGDPALGLVKMSRQAFEANWTGRLLILTPTAGLAESEPAKTVFARFVPYIKPYRSILLEVFLASLVLEIFALALPIFTQTVVDTVLAHHNVKVLNMMLGGMVVIGMFRTLTDLLRQYLLVHISSKLGLRMATDLFRHIMRLPLGYFRTRTVGDLITRFSDNAKVRQLLTGASITTLLDVLMIGVYLGLMLYYNVKLTGIALVSIPLFGLLTCLFTPRLRRANQQIFAKQAALSSHFVESVEEIDTIKASTAELPSRWKFENLIIQQVNAVFHSARLTMTLNSLSATLQMFSQTVLLWYGAHLVLQNQLSVGQLVAFQSLIGMVMTPIIGLISMWQSLQDALLSMERLSDIYDARPEDHSTSQGLHLPVLRGQVTFEHISFRYHPEDKNILTNIHIDITPGQTCAIVGRSGSGKTTLISLLQRFYAPTEGRILLDGYDLAAVSVASLRSQIGVVLQESAIFTGTIRENIALRDPEASMEQVLQAARLANAHDFIMTFPLGYNTVIGELGIRLSGGQKQRVCIARALFHNPRIIIFDEATSALDSESERAIQQNMQMILKDRTALIIAHRLSTIQHAEVILVLDDGALVEQGTHQELLEKRGLYYYLNSQQLTM